MTKKIIFILLFVCLVIGGIALYYLIRPKVNVFETITFNSQDDLEISADLYMTKNEDAPFIILFHQAGSSRGEYRSIAPRLNKLGFNCMAIDQRSGANKMGVVNQTNLNAIAKELPTGYVDAYIDLEAALDYVKDTIKPSKIIIWGSSYSASLVFHLAEDNTNTVDGILAFSPANYLSFNEQYLQDYKFYFDMPIFITSEKSETYRWEQIYDNLTTEKKVGFIPVNNGIHGSSSLFKSEEAHDEEYWRAVEDFLSTYFDTK